jgi:hypothetical protein
MYTRVAIRPVEWLTELPAIDTRRPGQQGVNSTPPRGFGGMSALPVTPEEAEQDQLLRFSATCGPVQRSKVAPRR